MIKQIKIINVNESSRLEKAVNDWLETLSPNVEIIQIFQTDHYRMTILYKTP